MKATDPAKLIDRLLNPAAPNRLPPPSLRRQYRLAVGLTQQQVADVVTAISGQPCDRSTVGRWEREVGKGGRDPQRELREAFGKVLDELKERVG